MTRATVSRHPETPPNGTIVPLFTPAAPLTLNPGQSGTIMPISLRNTQLD